MPPDSSCGSAFSNPVSPVSSISSSARRAACARSMPRISACSRMFLRAPRHSSSAARWKANPMSCCGPVTGRPSSDTVPSVGLTSPATTLSSVDFPHPDGPTIVTNSPASTRMVTSSSAVVCARLDRNRTDRSGDVDSGAGQLTARRSPGHPFAA